MLSSLVDSVIEACTKHGRKNRKVEGNAQTGWIVVDTGDTVVHIFSTDQRDYYNLEELWSSGKVLLRLT
jgi:ribosome-associated protein